MPLVQTRGAASAQGFGEFAQAAVAANYIEEVFSCFLYTGNGSTQTITNGIDLSTKGGLVWIKSRSQGTAGYEHILTDTLRGTSSQLNTASTAAVTTYTNALTAFNSTGFNLDSRTPVNASPETYVSWTFREQAKFFDVVTYTGTGSNTTIAHSLGAVPGSIIVKRTDTTAAWAVYHRSLANTQYLVLNTTAAAATGATWWNSTTPTSTEFSLGTDASVNASGGTYVAYVFAHDAGGFGLAGTDNVISCGTFTGSASGTNVNLGWEPQWVLIKRSSGNTDNWRIYDNMRGMTASNGGQLLYADTAGSETTNSRISVNATGFGFVDDDAYGNIYIAIRRGPMKVPTSGTSVFAPALGTSASTIPTFVTNFPVDLGFYHSRANTADWFLSSRLQGGGTLNTNTTYAEAAPDANYAFDSNTGWGKNFNSDKASSNFRRAPSFFDVCCYTGTGSARTIAHNLTVAPELMIVKSRSAADDWPCYFASLGATTYVHLNRDERDGGDSGTFWNSTAPTASVFSVATDAKVNGSGTTYVAYLFATCAGVSKVGTYTGTGTTKQIDCGFTSGARFVLIKRTSTAPSDWYVWDTARGIVSGNDPYLLVNSTAAEVTSTDYIDTYSAGFEISSTAPAAINASGGTFVFLAIA